MKRSIVLLIMGVISSIGIRAQSGQVEQEETASFSSVSIQGGGKVFLSNGKKNVFSSAGDQDKIDMKVINETLYITFPRISSDAVVNVVIPEFQAISVGGNASAESVDVLIGTTLKLHSGSRSDVNLNLNYHNLKTQVTGSGEVRLAGKAIVHEVQVSGEGDLFAFDMDTEVTKAQISGNGNLKINAIESVDVQVSGSGDVFLKGDPKEQNVSITGMGEMHTWGKDSLNTKDTTKLKFRKYNVLVIPKEHRWYDEGSDAKIKKKNKENRYWRGVGIGISGYEHQDKSFMGLGGSLSVADEFDFLELDFSNKRISNVNINLIEKGIKLFGGELNLVTGFGIETNSYSYKGQINILTDQEKITAIGDTNIFRFKNTLTSTYLNVPFLIGMPLKLRSKPKPFLVSVGAVVGYRFQTVYRQRYWTDATGEVNKKIFSDFNMNPLKASLRASFGYGNWSFYTTTSLSPLFKKDQGPWLYPYTLGVQLNF